MVISRMQENLGSVPKTIAVFDDDQDLLDIFQFFLEEEGYRVMLFNNCEDIALKLKTAQPALVLMDNWIPNIGGEAAIKEIRQDSEIAHIPVILVSANHRVEEIAKAAGADAAISKPFDFDEILKMIVQLSA